MSRGRLFLTLALLLMTAWAWPQKPDASTRLKHDELWSSIWLGNAKVEAAQSIEAGVEALGLQAKSPRRLVVFLHGYDMGREESDRFFSELAQNLKSNFPPESTLCLGVQWDSGGGLLATDYFQMVERARNLGRDPLRRILLQLKERYPSLPLVILAHSMGCEMATAALTPEMRYPNHQPKVEVFAPQEQIEAQMAVFAGSDLDSDVWQQNPQAGLSWFKRCDLTWVTVSDPTTRGDRVLSLRARIRGKAMGALLPRLSQEQLDLVIPAAKLYIDGMDIPSDHEFDSYYSPARLKRLALAMAYLAADGSSGVPKPAELSAMEQALKAPAKIESLLPYLDSDYAGAALTSLWRIENLNCGSSKHLADGTIEEAIRLLSDKPRLIWPLQKYSSCLSLRNTWFPTPKTMVKAGAPAWSRPARYR